MELVLVTGASGFVGSHVVEQLLQANYRVRGTARSEKAEHVRQAYASSEYADNLEVVIVEDLATSDLTSAFQGVDALIHVGTPLGGAGSAEVVLQSTISGTCRVLQHASDAGLKKIVLTGSVINLLDTRTKWTRQTLTEDDWSPLTYEHATQPGVDSREVYAVAKKLAEQEFWAFADAHPAIYATSILPPWLYGPYGRGQWVRSLKSGTNQLVYALIAGPPGRPMHAQNVNPGFSHVADAARAHVLALSARPARSGEKRKRVVVMGGYGLWREAVAHLRAVRPELGARLPVLTGNESEQDPEEYAMFDGGSARRVLGMDTFKTWEETILETVDDMVRMEKVLDVSTPLV